ncbi:hypothetical protein TRVA0_037S01244 [Trichomonascus vanleenenianus]|uniref:pirin family protein n=1 Tax=Trichomonascus vanleenenianus TaxID=2268995 RepID=UPI003ECA16CA
MYQRPIKTLVSLSLFIGFLAICYNLFSEKTTIKPRSEPIATEEMSATKFTPRSIAKKILAVEQSEGVGARVRRSIGTLQLRHFSPFLMLDHFKTGTKGGFPDHPHRGQETITYMMKGYVDHEDFTGSAGTIGPGDLQFMTAGRGIVHAEMPRIGEDGVSPEGMQLWVDLPENLKHVEPRYRDLRAREIPIARPSDKVEIKVISGDSHGIESVRDLAYTPVWYFDVTIKPGGTVDQIMPEDFNAFLYVLCGTVKINNETTVPQFHNVLFKRDGDGVTVSVPEDATEEARLVIIGGKMLDQPIVQHGPFVETSQEKIYQAFVDYQMGTNGFEKAVNWHSKIGKRNG